MDCLANPGRKILGFLDRKGSLENRDKRKKPFFTPKISEEVINSPLRISFIAVKLFIFDPGILRIGKNTVVFYKDILEGIGNREGFNGNPLI